MTPRTRSHNTPTPRICFLLMVFALAGLTGCSTPPPPPKPAPPPPPPPQAMPEPVRPYVPMPEILVPERPAVQSPVPRHQSLARTPAEYRKDAASHLYAQHRDRVFKGRLPPMLEAVGVMHVDIDQRGGVKAIHWQRAPRHAPQVMREIERMVRAAAPYPAPVHLKQVTYTDVWLWHRSGRFQLDTLTEGQD